jgi:hypothetical protein
MVYTAFTSTEEVRKRMVTEAQAGGPERLRHLVEEDFGICGPWAVPGLKAQLCKAVLDDIDWNEIHVELLLLAMPLQRPQAAATASVVR